MAKITEVGTVTNKEHNPRRVDLDSKSYFERFQSGDPDCDVAEVFHENTKYTDELGRKLGQSAKEFKSPVLMEVQADIDPTYSGAETVPLPDPASDLDISLADALAERRSVHSFGDEPVSLESLSTLLSHACGVTYRERVEIEDSDTQFEQTFRAYPSAGALYPIEMYPIAFDVDGLDAGVYHYTHGAHRLERVKEADAEFESTVSELVASSGDTVSVEDASALVVLTGSFRRSKAKYGPRGYRFALQESGHLVQNVQLVGSALDLGILPLGGYREYPTDDLLGVDGVNESTVYAFLLGTAEREGEA